MQRISSQWTLVYKRMLPVLVVGALPLAIIWSIRVRNPAWIVMAGVFGLLSIRRWYFDLADEVWDDGDALIVKNAGLEERRA